MTEGTRQRPPMTMSPRERVTPVVASAGLKLEPVPVPGCDVCEPCGQERGAARQAGRSLEVRSLNGVIAGHPHGRKVRG